MENSSDKRKQQKVSTAGSNNLSKTKDQIAQNILTEHGGVVARQATKVLAEKAKDADKQTGANWRQVYSELEGSIRMRHYSPRTLKSYVGYTKQFQAFVYREKCHLERSKKPFGFLICLPALFLRKWLQDYTTSQSQRLKWQC
ncbi:hypothetical protein [Desulforhopalus sp. 52FAK]